jgi:hypothetical protein
MVIDSAMVGSIEPAKSLDGLLPSTCAFHTAFLLVCLEELRAVSLCPLVSLLMPLPVEMELMVEQLDCSTFFFFLFSCLT